MGLTASHGLSLCWSLILMPGASHLNTLDLTFLIFKTGMTIIPCQRVVLKIKRDHLPKALWMVLGTQ